MMNSNSYKLIASIPLLKVSHVFSLEKGRRYLLGSAEMEPEMLVFSPDRSMSRRQAWLEIVDDELRVERHPKASQNLNADASVKTVLLKSGEAFKAGLTVFRFVVAQDDIAQPAPDITYTLTATDFAMALRERGTKSFLEIIRLMPSLMRENETSADFLLALCEAIHAHVSGIQVTAWSVQMRADLPEIMLLSRSASSAKAGAELIPTLPSRHLVKQAFSSAREESVVSLWSRRANTMDSAQSMISSSAEWAMCIPISLSERERFALYATGTDALLEAEQNEVRQFLAALGALAKEHLLAARTKERQGQIGQFFSPAVRSILFGEATEASRALIPEEYEATICFFDLRGSSRLAENLGISANRTVAEYFSLLERILGDATSVIFETGGIVIDFQGDAILACWGVPRAAALRDSIRRAGQAAQQIIELIIEHDWPAEESHLRCGIGITSGKVLAGLFTAHGAGAALSKYTVIGHPVNQAARLEGMTKKFDVPILIDGGVAVVLAGENVLARRIAAVRPAGMSYVVQLYELVLPKELGGSGVTAEGVRAYETALAFFERGEFDAATQAMRAVPNDPIELFLSEQITLMRRHGAPPGWDGVIDMLAK